jgi:O-antigen/teichoic acid export membrane protein
VTDDPQSVEGVRKLVVRGVAWKTLSAIVLQLSRLATAIVLARLLAPSDYGLAAMVLVFSSLVLIFADLALGSALVQRRDLTEADRSTVFWTGAAAGLVFTILGVALSGPIAAFYGEPDVRPLLAAFSITFFVTALASTQAALLNRAMDFRSLELREMIAYGAGAVVGITVAATGGGAWAIIWQQITIAVGSTVLLTLFVPWRPRLIYSIASLRNLGGFGARVFATRLLFYLNRNVDSLLIGRYLGPGALGAYGLSYNVILTPFSSIAGPIQDVLFPAFSRLQDDPARIGSAWIRVNRLVGAISIPGLIGLIIVAPDFVAVVLGERWSAAVPVLQILAWVGLLQSLQRLNSSILQARDRTATLLRYAVIVFTASVVAFVGGLHWGIVGVATAYAISSSVVEPYYTWLTGRAIGVRVREFVAGLRGVIEATVVMAAAVLLVRTALVEADVAAAIRLAVCILTGIVVYLPVVALRSPPLVQEVRGLRPERRSGSSPAATVEAS